MSQKNSRGCSIWLGGIGGGILGFMLSLFVLFLPVGWQIVDLLGDSELEAGLFMLFAYFPASILIGAITGALIAVWCSRDRG